MSPPVLTQWEFETGVLTFQLLIEAVNGIGGTTINTLIGRVDGEEREWTIAVEDTDEPLETAQ